MRFHLLDRIDAWYPGERATGIKAVTRTDGAAPDVATGWTGRTILIESLAQLASYLLGDTEAREGRRVLSLMIGVDRMAFQAEPRPGDRLALEARVVARGAEGARVEVRARAGERPVCDGRLTFAFFAAESAEQARDFAWTRDHLLLLARGCVEGDPPRGLALGEAS